MNTKEYRDYNALSEFCLFCVIDLQVCSSPEVYYDPERRKAGRKLFKLLQEAGHISKREKYKGPRPLEDALEEKVKYLMTLIPSLPEDKGNQYFEVLNSVLNGELKVSEAVVFFEHERSYYNKKLLIKE